jgi:hypothetical protein
MKKQILLALGIVCLLQPNLFAMRSKPMGSAERQAAIKQAIHKKDYAKANELAQGLKGPNKALFQSRLNTLQQDVAQGAPAQVIAQDQRVAVDAVAMPERQAAAVAQQEGITYSIVTETEETVRTKGNKDLEDVSVTVARVDGAKVNAAQMNYAAARMIADKLVRETDLGKTSKQATVPANAAIPIDSIRIMPERYREFAIMTNSILTMRHNQDDPYDDVECLRKLKAAFDEGKKIFWQEVQEIYRTSALERAQIYYPSKFAEGWSAPADEPRKTGFYTIFSVDVKPARLKTAIVDQYYDSTLVQLVRGLDAIWIMFQADWRARAVSNPWPDFTDPVWSQMKKELELMQVVADATFYLVGAAFGAEKRITMRSDAAWNSANPYTKRFFADIAQDANRNSYPMGLIDSNSAQKAMLNTMPGGQAFLEALTKYFQQ